MLSSALDYAARGWRVFPQAGKVPMIAGGGGVKDATTDEAQISEWWQRYPRSNIGIACGFGWWALDVDGQNGARTMAELTSRHGPLPKTVTSRTGGDGWHLLFRLPSGVDLRNWTGGQCAAWPHRGVDIRARGVPITAPPSLHASGRLYRWVDGRDPDSIDISDPPGWLVELVTPTPSPPVVEARDPLDDGWGPRPQYSRMALNDACERILQAADGCQEAVLNREAFGMGQLAAAGLMVEERCRAWLIRAGVMMESYDPHKPWTESLIRRKVDSAIAAGKRRPNVRALYGESRARNSKMPIG